MDANITGQIGMRLPNLTDVVAGETLAIAAPCYIKSSDGKVYMSTGAATNEAAEVMGFTPKAYVTNEPVTLFGVGALFHYSDDFSAGTVSPGDLLYLTSTAGALGPSTSSGDATGTAVVIDNKHIAVKRWLRQ